MDVLPETAFVHRSVSKRPLHFNINQCQEGPSEGKDLERSETFKGATIARSTSAGPSLRETMPLPNAARKLTILLRFLNINSASATKYLFVFQSKSRQGRSLNTQKNRITKRRQAKRRVI